MDKAKGKKYERISDRVKRTGEYELLDPFDYFVLEKLPEEGELLGGYYPVTTSVVELRKRYFPALTAAKISSRVRIMENQGLVKVMKTGTHNGWQRTKAGKEVYETWQQSQSNGS